MTDIEKYQSLCAAKPENALYRFSFGKALFDAGRYPDAIKAFQFCLSVRDDWMVVWILMGRALLADGQAAAAETHLKTALELAIEQEHEDPEHEIRSLLESL
ncbi:MAG: molecular chaperone DnaJ [Verrucomicrobiota bacterium]